MITVCFSVWSQFCNSECYMWCPDGSVLGPLLFLTYIIDIPNISSKLAFFLFVDDTSIYFESGNLEQLRKVINFELKYVNVEKTNFVIFNSPQKSVHENITTKFDRQHVKRLSMSNSVVSFWGNIFLGSIT